MTSNSKVLEMKIGLSKDIHVTVYDKIAKQYVNITGDVFYFTVKETPFHVDQDAVLQVSATGAGADGAAGKVIIPVAVDDTLAVEAGNYDYDIVWLRSVSYPGKRVLVEEGTVSFTKPVTQATS